ncbi:TPA: hypothetical protein ACXIY6_003750 [Serratia marcescens]
MDNEHKQKIAVTISEYTNFAPIHLFNYKKYIKIIMLSMQDANFKHLNNDHFDSLEHYENTFHEIFLELNKNIENIFIFDSKKIDIMVFACEDYITNRVIIGLVLALLILLICTFYSSMETKMELGSLSDWISSLSTAGTLLVAYMAYKKAPKWLNQRMHEDALTMATSLLFDDYTNLNRKIIQSSVIIEHIKLMNEFVSDNFRDFITVDECERYLSMLDDTDIIPTKINDKVRNLKKLGWCIKEPVHKNNNELLNSYTTINKSFMVLCISLKKLITEEDENSAKTHYNMFLKGIERFDDSTMKFKTLYDELQSRHSKIPDYFIINEK